MFSLIRSLVQPWDCRVPWPYGVPGSYTYYYNSVTLHYCHFSDRGVEKLLKLCSEIQGEMLGIA